MAKQRYINTKFWDDNFIIDLDPIEKLLFLYVLTNPLTNISGIYEISLRRISFDTGIDSEMVLKMLSRFENSQKMKYSDGWIALKNFVKHQSLNPKIEKGIEIEKKRAPEKLVKWVENSLCIAYDSLSDLNSNINTNTNTNANIKNKNNKIKYAERVLLTADQYNDLISTYSKKAIDDKIQIMSDYLLSNGKKYKDCAAALRNWFRRDTKPQKTAQETLEEKIIREANNG